MRSHIIRALSVATVAGLVGLSGFVAPVAVAMPEPSYDPAKDIAPPDATPSPALPMEQKYECVQSVLLENSQLDTIPANNVFRVDKLNQLAVGRGQTVAVIDSGVNTNVRLSNLIGGGDYIMGGDGLQDCDHHGTLVAGIIAARPSQFPPGDPKWDAFVGVAPEAAILSIRQTSRAYEPVRPPSGYDALAKSASSIYSLAQAVRRAADMGATVINMSVTSCFPAGTPVDDSALAGALHYAAVEKDVVLVAAAGNVGDTCKQNPGPSTSHPGDIRGWETVENVSLPSAWDQFVLSVGGTTLNGEPYVNTMGGPWVGVAAPAQNIISLHPSDGANGTLVNAQLKEGENIPINGTSLASAYVSGLAALIREKFPNLTAHQVIGRITDTAHDPGTDVANLLGHGVVDPVAALTATLPAGPKVAAGVPAQGVSALPDAVKPDTLARDMTIRILIVAGVVIVVFAAVGLAVSSVNYRKNATSGAPFSTEQD